MTGAPPTLLLTREEVRGLVRMAQVIASVEDAFVAYSEGAVDQPPYMGLHLSTEGAEIDFKACYHRGEETVSLKASSGGFRDNPDRCGLPNGMGTVLLFDGTSGALLCAMDGSLLTGLRTGAAGAVSVKAMARHNARVVGVLGTGTQARMQIRAIREVMPIEEIHAWGRTRASLEAFAAEIEAEHSIPVVSHRSADDVADAADVIVTTTRASGIVLRAGAVRPGTHIVAIGADQPGKQELDPALFDGARVAVDALAQCREKGELQHALAAGTATGPITEIGAVLAGKTPGRASAEEITIFDSTGMAIQDCTTAAAILSEARARGIGTRFDFLAPMSRE